MGERLEKPPLIEAICEFRFKPDEKWDWILPGRLYDLIHDDFPERKQVDGISFQLSVEKAKPSTSQFSKSPERIQLWRKDQTAMVQIGPHLLAINQFPPYPSWENFRDLILDIFKKHGSLLENLGLERIGLRYVNQINIVHRNCTPDKIVTIFPSLKRSFDKRVDGFFIRFELIHDSPSGKLVFQAGNKKSGDLEPIILDIDFFSTNVATLTTIPELSVWMDEAHNRIYESFIDSLDPELVDYFRRGE